MASLTFDTLKDVVTKDHLDYKLAELKTKLIKWVLIRNANVFDSASGRLLPNQQIVISSGRIEEVAGEPRQVDDARVIDAGGRVVLPGLIDAHVHVGGGVA